MLISRAQTCLRQWFERYNQGLHFIEATTRMDPGPLPLHETWSTCDQLVRELVQVLNALRPWQALAQLLHLSVGQIAEKQQMLASINASKANALRSVLEQGIETDTLPSGVRSSGSETTTRPEEQKEDDDDDHGAKEPSCDRTRPEHSSLATLRNGSTASLAIAQRRLMNALLDMARRGDPHTGIGSRAAARGVGGGGQASAKTSR
ncbi:hypothetical protein F1559_003981 [Cyanidiococcus yangmingshanensis]|uniref:Uncharacterized protein n=1 Tax=Cyanidiococcus yangmingshanensis TaxID=2690220 RepID=A0A7J7IJU3_9RHOD|nr:hypothetical protein F1559_003981 [Cyanidiococcus yangmingshanensis]